MLLLPVVLAPSLIVAISLAERRFGPGMAGRLNAIPLSIALAVLGVAADRGARAGAAVAEAAAAHVPAQVAFALAFAAVLARVAARGDDAVARGGPVAVARGGPVAVARGGPVAAARGGPVAAARGGADGAAGGGADGAAGGGANGAAGGGPVAVARGGADGARRRRLVCVVAGLAAATAAFAALSLVIATLPAGVAIAAALPALAYGRHVLDGTERVAEDREGGAAELVARAAVALVFILAVLAAVRVAGPGLAGAIAAFPALTATLAVMIGRTRGPVAVAHLLAGVVNGLTGYLAFCVALAFTAPGLGLLAAPLAAAACAAGYAASWQGDRIRASAA